MIYHEPEIFTGAKAAALVADADVICKGEEELSPAKFPFVSIVEKANSSYDATVDSGSRENHASLTYEVNIYTNDETGKKARAAKIIAAINDYFIGIGFYRTFNQPVPNAANPEIHRRTARFETVMSKDKQTFRR